MRRLGRPTRTGLLARDPGASRPEASGAALLPAFGMSMEWNLGGIHPMTLPMALGLLARAYRRRRILSQLLLAASLLTHPAGGALSALTLLLRGALEWRPSGCPHRRHRGTPGGPALRPAPPLVPQHVPPVDAPDSPLEMVPPIPTPYSPGLIVICLGLLGAQRLHRRHPSWTRTVLTCRAIAWATAGPVAPGLTSHLPPGRNPLVDSACGPRRCWPPPRTPCFPPSACPGRGLALAIPTVASGAAIALTAALAGPALTSHPSDPAKAWRWVEEHHPPDPFTRVVPGPVLQGLKLPESSAANSPRVGPRPTGYFSQGRPHLTAPVARTEWRSGSWWYLPGAPTVLTWLTNSRYLVTVSPHVVRDAERHGLRAVYRAGPATVLENRRTSAVEAVDPIGVYDANLGTERLLEAYTTALVLTPYRGSRLTFAVANDPEELRKFDRVIVRPRSERDVETALRLARSGRRVLLVPPAHRPQLARRAAELIGLPVHRTRLRFHPRDPTDRIVQDWRRIGARVLHIVPLHRPTTVPAYLIDGRLWADVRVGKGLVRVSGIDPAHLALTLHPVPTQTPRNHWVVPLPDARERGLLTRLLSGFDSPPPRPVPYRHDGVVRITLRPTHRWMMVKVMATPEWRIRGGRAYLGPGGVMILQVKRTPVELRYVPARSTASELLPLVAALALVVRAWRGMRR